MSNDSTAEGDKNHGQILGAIASRKMRDNVHTLDFPNLLEVRI